MAVSQYTLIKEKHGHTRSTVLFYNKCYGAPVDALKYDVWLEDFIESKLKRCLACNQSKTKESFPAHNAVIDGYLHICSQCKPPHHMTLNKMSDLERMRKKRILDRKYRQEGRDKESKKRYYEKKSKDIRWRIARNLQGRIRQGLKAKPN